MQPSTNGSRDTSPIFLLSTTPATVRVPTTIIVQLQGYDWPGNVRELQNVIELAVILARGGVLQFDLPVRGVPPETRPQARRTEEPELGFLTESEMQQRERENLLAVLEKADWRVRGPGGAAELLGVKASTFQSRMKAMGLKRPE